MNSVEILGKVFIGGNIKTLTGLHIGKGKEGIQIGGVDNAVMRDLLTNEPYIPGSSLKGKLRSLAEKRANAVQNQGMGRGIRIHVCKNQDPCKICKLYGVPAENAQEPTRLAVKDMFLSPDSKTRLEAAETDLPFTEVKFEAAIDRVTAKANPRPVERVPRDTLFTGMEMVVTIYESSDFSLVFDLLETMRLLEDDFLGGSGSRGSGRICFEGLSITIKPAAFYHDPTTPIYQASFNSLDSLLSQKASLSTDWPTRIAPAASGT
jgi:CRISPR-associated protein Csm3